MNEHQERLLAKNILFIGDEYIGRPTFDYAQEAWMRLAVRGFPPIDVYITSNGGSMDFGLDIYDLLRSYPEETTGIVQSRAKSVAVLILQGCRRRKIMEHALLFIHHPARNGLTITLDDFVSPETLNRIRESLEEDKATNVEILTRHTGKTPQDIVAACAKRAYMSAKEALAFGLVDEILEPSSEKKD